MWRGGRSEQPGSLVTSIRLLSHDTSRCCRGPARVGGASRPTPYQARRVRPSRSAQSRPATAVATGYKPQREERSRITVRVVRTETAGSRSNRHSRRRSSECSVRAMHKCGFRGCRPVKRMLDPTRRRESLAFRLVEFWHTLPRGRFTEAPPTIDVASGRAALRQTAAGIPRISTCPTSPRPLP